MREHANDLGRRKTFGRRWGDNRIARWTSEAMLIAMLAAFLFGLAIGTTAG